MLWFSPIAPAAESAWVAVGESCRSAFSPDAIHWTDAPSSLPKGGSLQNVATGLGRILAVGSSANSALVLSSTNGQAWRPIPIASGYLNTIAFGNGRFVLYGQSGWLVSSDGENFQQGAPASPGATARRSVFGSGEAGPRFVLIGDHAEMGWRASSEDGLRWTSNASNQPRAEDLAFGNGRFVLVGAHGLIESSHDGQTWQRHPSDPQQDFSRVVWSGERFLASGSSQIWSSTDGLAWKLEIRNPPNQTSPQIIWARDKPNPLALAHFLDRGWQFSSDLLHWSPCKMAFGPAFLAITRTPEPPSAPP